MIPLHDPRVSHLPTPEGDAYRASLPEWVDVRKCTFCHPETGCLLPREFRARHMQRVGLRVVGGRRVTTIIIDADACPVTRDAIEIARSHGLRARLVANHNQSFARYEGRAGSTAST